MTPKTIRGFAVVYALLFLVLIGSGLGAYAAYTLPSVKHDVAAVKASLGDQNLTRLANEYVKRIAAGQGFSVRKLTVLRVNAPKGSDGATVTVRVTVADAVGVVQTLNLVVSFKRGVWQATNAAAA